MGNSIAKAKSMNAKKQKTQSRVPPRKKFFGGTRPQEVSVAPETFENSFEADFDQAFQEVNEDDFLPVEEIDYNAEPEELYDDQSFDRFFGDEVSTEDGEGEKQGDERAATPQADDVLSAEALDKIAQKAEQEKQAFVSPGESSKIDGRREAAALSPFGRFMEALTPWVIWGCMASVIASLLYAIYVGGANWISLLLLSGGILAFFGLLLAGSRSNTFSPQMLTGVLFRRARGVDGAEAIQLAGKDILYPMAIADDILDVDVDARLVTTDEGIVVYANRAYMAIAREAGVLGAAGLPPRVDRLFAQAGPESRKIFHLCRAAKSGLAAEEVITQLMGVGSNSRHRRFEITIRPMTKTISPGEGKKAQTIKYVAWRLREMAVEEVSDTLIIAYQDYPRPVLGLELSGRVAWMNKAMAKFLGVTTRTPLHLSDIVLGETDELIEGLWDEDDDSPVQSRLRQAGGGAVDALLTPFGQGGVGEGFVCLEVQPNIEATTHNQEITGDLTEAPFGVAVIEGDIGSDAKLVDSNKMFAETFAIDGKAAALGQCLDSKTVRDLANAIKNRSASTPLARPVEVEIGEGANACFVALYARPVKRRRGSYGKRRTILYAVDVTFQKRMEEDYSQDQKLKTIGHLAGSIAHDFNNVLLVIMGSVELLMRRHMVGDPSYGDLVQIQQNAQRARNLTRNLLAFSRKQTLQSEVFSITEMLREFSPFLNRSITERIQLDVINGRGLSKVKADKGQLELAIMNLAVNARDAMPQGGNIVITTKNVPAQEIGDYGYPVLEEIDHVLIEVADNGSGVPEEIADKIFEPFFTTKGEGKGTGLGLSTVYGVIGQMGGRIFLHNRPGEGATFRIFLPSYQLSEEEMADERATAQTKSASDNADLTGRGRILIVEDEDGARGIIVRALEMCGYEIVEACDGDEALEILQESDEPFDLLLSDIMMPEMDGPTLVQTAENHLKGTEIIFMSGYAEGAMRDKLDQIKGAGYLQKPFSLKTVAEKVKEALSE